VFTETRCTSSIRVVGRELSEAATLDVYEGLLQSFEVAEPHLLAPGLGQATEALRTASYL
jgi:hypothetical protein